MDVDDSRTASSDQSIQGRTGINSRHTQPYGTILARICHHNSGLRCSRHGLECVPNLGRAIFCSRAWAVNRGGRDAAWPRNRDFRILWAACRWLDYRSVAVCRPHRCCGSRGAHGLDFTRTAFSRLRTRGRSHDSLAAADTDRLPYVVALRCRSGRDCRTDTTTHESAGFSHIPVVCKLVGHRPRTVCHGVANGQLFQK